MSKTKYIFLDIDGTLLDSNSHVLDSTKLAIKLAQQNGHKIFIATGRAIRLVPDCLKEINFDGYVAATGSYVEYQSKVIYEKYFSQEQISYINKFMKKNNIAIILSAKNECVIPKYSLDDYVHFFSDGKKTIDDIEKLEDLNSSFVESIEPILIVDDIDDYCSTEKYVSDYIYINSPYDVSEMQKFFGDTIHVEKASYKEPDEHSGEITLADCTKSSGISKLLDYVGASVDDCIAIGDGFNDMDMLKFAGLSIAMDNSPDEVKQTADYITDDCDSDGIFKAFKKFNIC